MSDAVTQYPPSDVPTHQAALRALCQAAADVELFTIPLYMTALYSIRGTYAAPADGQQLWPGMRPVPASSDDPNQLAYNAIFSVYVQEMFHLQLASNLCSAMGLSPTFQAPKYGGTTIPCIGDLSKVPGYEDVKVELGPLDYDRIKLFIAIETPDWEAPGPKPAVPFAGWTRGDDLPEFATIGHLYDCIAEYMDLEYTDGQTLFEKTWDKDAVQVDLFDFVDSGHPAEVYPDMPVKLDPTMTVDEARAAAGTIITAIIEQGEGSTETDPDVQAEYVPSALGLTQDRGTDDAAVRVFWDQLGHWNRFQFVSQILDQVETWPQWWASRGGVGAWTWQDLIAVPEVVQGRAADDKSTGIQGDDIAFAQARARAMNDPYTATQLNQALNESYTSLLAAIEASWTDPRWSQEWAKEKAKRSKKLDADDTSPTTLFPYAAMQALYTRVAAIWATGTVPEFAHATVQPIDPAEAHACQGLDPNDPGANSCANAVIHTCAGSNSCKHQGGCGYPNPADDGYPNVNQQRGGGGCGAPIPVAQVLNPSGGKSKWTYSWTEGGKTQRVRFQAGDNVWDTAWEIFQKQNPEAKKKQAPTPTNLRLVLPPS